MINVSIVCDSLLVAEGFQRLVESDDIRCSRRARLEKGEAPDVVVYVVGQTPFSRLAFRRLLDGHPSARLLVVGLWLPEDVARSFRDEGAYGFMSQEASRLQLIEAIRVIDQGNRYFAPGIDALPRADVRGAPPLSRREMEILAGIRAGRSAKAIAHELEISVKTVSTYRRRILDKLGLDTNAELIVLDWQGEGRRGEAGDLSQSTTLPED